MSMPISELSPEQELQAIAQAIDEATDDNNETLNAQALDRCDQLEPRLQLEAHSAMLDYFRANAWANRMEANHGDVAAAWAWDQEERQKQIFFLRRALGNSAFGELHIVRQCQILTNLGNQLDTVGRFVEARQLWARALTLLPTFWMARANRGHGLMHYAQALYDPNHRAVFALSAHQDIDDALLHMEAFPELGDTQLRTYFVAEAENIKEHFDLAAIKARYKPDGHSLGRSKLEQAYRRWCLDAGLFLNPLNDLAPDSIAAHDVLTQPDFVTAIHESPVLAGFFNQLKQEFVSARWLYFQGITRDRVHASDRGVLLYNTLDFPALGLGVEQVKVAFRMCYSLFDKVAYFLNHYMKLGIPEKQIYFKSIWKKKDSDQVRPEFQSSENWPLRGLYWLSKDFFEDDFKSVMEPDAQNFHHLRNHLEHKYVKVLSTIAGSSGKTKPGPFDDTLAHTLPLQNLEGKTLKLLQLARAALIYLSLGMHREEMRRRERTPSNGLIMPMPLGTWDDNMKRRW